MNYLVTLAKTKKKKREEKPNLKNSKSKLLAPPPLPSRLH